jgi:hypothetical protein
MAGFNLMRGLRSIGKRRISTTDLFDVSPTAPADGEALIFDEESGLYVPGTVASEGASIVPITRWGWAPTQFQAYEGSVSGGTSSETGSYKDWSSTTTPGSFAYNTLRMGAVPDHDVRLDAMYSLILTRMGTPTEGDIIVGFCGPTVPAFDGTTGIDFTDHHVAITCEIRSSAVTWYASNANGSAQTKTQITVNASKDTLVSIIRTDTSITFYINGAAPVTHTTNSPSAGEVRWIAGAANRNTATNVIIRASAASADFYHA